MLFRSMMIFAAFVKKWDDGILVSADHAGIRQLIDNLLSRNEIMICSRDEWHGMRGMNLKIKTNEPRNGCTKSRDEITLNLSCSASIDFMRLLKSLENSDKPCHQYFDMDDEITGSGLSVMISTGEYFMG